MSTNGDTDTEFKIISGEKDNTVIVLLLGQARSQEVPELEGLINFLVEKPHTCVIFSFRDLIQFLPGAHATLAKMLSTLRKAGKHIAICSLRPEVKMSLLQAGVIRESEMYNNIPESWQGLKTRMIESEVESKPTLEKKAA